MFSVLETTTKDLTFLQSKDLRAVRTDQDLQEALDWLYFKDLIAFDIETTGLSVIYDQIVGFSFGDASTAFYVPIAHSLEQNVPKEFVSKLLAQISQKKLIYHNAKFDWKFIYVKYGIDLPITHDTLALAALSDSDKIEAKGSLSLKHLVKELLGVDMLELKEDLQTTDFSVVPIEDALWYAAPDSLCTFMLYAKLIPNLKTYDFGTIYDLEISIIKYVAQIEINGIRLDTKFIVSNTERLNIMVSNLKKEIEAYGGGSYDIDSPQQLSDLIYNQLKIRKIRESTSTDVRILEQLEEDHEIIPKLQLYSSISTLQSSFFGKILGTISEDGRLHSDFNQFGTRSGRFSSSGGTGRNGSSIKLNLQQMPKEHEGFNIRKAFIPEEGYYWLHADYSQLEYRVMASLSEETALIDAFVKGIDFHSQTASIFLKIPLDKVTKDDRSKGKTLNFAVSYGMSKYGLANKLKIAVKIAEKMLEDYFANLQKLKLLIRNIKEGAMKNSYVKTYFGRMRWFRDMPSDHELLVKYLRKTFNTYVQGTAADIAKMGIRNVFQALEKADFDMRCVSTIHDELNFEVHKSIPPAIAAAFIKKHMDINFPNDKKIRWCPITADVSVGPSFGEQYDIEPQHYALDTVLYDDFVKIISGKESSVEETISKIPVSKPAIIINGKVSRRKMESLKSLILKNIGEYNIYFVDGYDIFSFAPNFKINPVPFVLNEISNLGFECELVYDKSDLKLDLDKILK